MRTFSHDAKESSEHKVFFFFFFSSRAPNWQTSVAMAYQTNVAVSLCIAAGAGEGSMGQGAHRE